MNKIILISICALFFYNCTTRNPKVEFVKTPWLGVELDESEEKLVVGRVIPNSPAALASVEPGDVIVAFNNKPMGEPAAIHRELQTLGALHTTVITVSRAGESFTLRIRPTTLALLDDNFMTWNDGHCDQKCNCSFDTLATCISIYRFYGRSNSGASTYAKYCTDTDTPLKGCYLVTLL